MAQYTCIMLFISAFEHEQERIAEVNSFLNRGQPFELIDVNDTKKFPDAFPRFLYVGTYKNFDIQQFLMHISGNVGWEYPEYVQIFVQEEADYNIKVYSNAGKILSLDSDKATLD